MEFRKNEEDSKVLEDGRLVFSESDLALVASEKSNDSDQAIVEFSTAESWLQGGHVDNTLTWEEDLFHGDKEE